MVLARQYSSLIITRLIPWSKWYHLHFHPDGEFCWSATCLLITLSRPEGGGQGQITSTYFASTFCSCSHAYHTSHAYLSYHDYHASHVSCFLMLLVILPKLLKPNQALVWQCVQNTILCCSRVWISGFIFFCNNFRFDDESLSTEYVGHNQYGSKKSAISTWTDVSAKLGSENKIEKNSI